MQTWSEAFDQATALLKSSKEKKLKTESILYLIQQNKTHTANLWSFYRPLSERHRCFLQAICFAVNVEGRPDSILADKKSSLKLNDKIHTKSVAGNYVPHEDLSCPQNVSWQDLLSELGDLNFERDCNMCGFNDIYKRNIKALCWQHAEVQQQIFERSLQKLLISDGTRKVLGYFSNFTRDLVEHLAIVFPPTERFVHKLNAVFNNLCTLNQVDKW